jgi:hypothetical protein
MLRFSDMAQQSLQSFFPVTEFGSAIQQVAMPLVTLVDDHLVPLGTGFMIAADGLMMTASHVIDQATRASGKRIGAPAARVHREFYALYVTAERLSDASENNLGGLWPVDRAWCSPELDIGFCWLRRAERDGVPIRHRCVTLSPALPAIGSRIIGFGYYGMTGSAIRREPGSGPSIEYSQETAHTAGVITEIYPVQRDSGMLKFPSFQTDARFDPGMSGGPVFNESGHVCGVTCSSLPPMQDSGHVSFASLIWPSLGTSLEIAVGEGSPVQAHLVHDLVLRGFIATDSGISKVRVVRNADGTRTVALQP